MTHRHQPDTRDEPNRQTPAPAPSSLTGILDVLPFGIVLLNQNNLIHEINPEGARLLGRHRSSLLGASFPDIWSALTQSDSASVAAQLSRVAATKQPLPQTVASIRLSSADALPVQWTCQSIDRADRPGLVVSLCDLSRQEELREERDRLAAIAEESPSPIVELDRQADMLYANPAMTAWLAKLGYRADGRPAILPEGLPQLVAHCLQSGTIVHGREAVLPQASFTWTFCPVVTHGLVRGYALDMTRIYQAQQELRRTADQLQDSNRRLDDALAAAQESVRAKTAFLATMSHELRTPLNGVIGMTSLLMETELSAEQQSYIGTVRQCGEALLHLINDILECSKIEAGKLELECLDFNLRTTVEDILAQFAERAETKGLELTGLVHAAVPTALRGDPGRLRQVLSNLVGNAIKFTDKGEVTLQAYLERDDTNTAVIRFEVADTGIGIAPETQAKLFQPFVQADSSTTRKYGGTGLGLSISKQLIGLMGGQTGITSTLGHGSTFWCTARFGKQPAPSTTAPATAELEGRRILIVDDNESNCMILHHLVSSWGMVDEVAKDAASAMERMTQAHARGLAFDLAILDVMMPGKDGLELAQDFRRHPAGTGTRIVVLTSLLQRGHAEQARQAGAMGYLPKPVRHDQLRDCLRMVLGLSPGPAPGLRQADPMPPLVTRHTIAEQAPRQRILIVEDNLINQKLAVRMAEKLGYQPSVAGNGQEALEALANEDFAAILMDCQMPIMDGFEATGIIREREKRQWSLVTGQESHDASNSSGSSPMTVDQSPMTHRHIPIIAVTANAMQGDRAHCLAVGMDDYLTKPIRLDALREVLHRWTAPAMPPPVQASPPSEAQANERGVFDADKMFQNIGADNHLFGQLVGLFLDQHQAMLAEIKEGLIQGDALAVERAAHTLKGTAGNLCAPEVVLAASRLEAIGHLGALQDTPPIYAQLEKEVLRLVRALGPFRQGYTPIPLAA